MVYYGWTGGSFLSLFLVIETRKLRGQGRLFHFKGNASYKPQRWFIVVLVISLGRFLYVGIEPKPYKRSASVLPCESTPISFICLSLMNFTSYK